MPRFLIIMIQDILPHRFHNEYRPALPVKGDLVFGYGDNMILMKDDHSFFHYEDIPPHTPMSYLFSLDDHNCFIGDLRDLKTYAASTRCMRSFRPRHLAFAAMVGRQIGQWLDANKYCGHCGKPMIIDRHERALRCVSCGQIVYPRIMPAVIVGVLNRDRLLVARYTHSHLPHNHYALIAGFNEIGETIEETVYREVKEETGLTVDQLSYYKSQPWPFSSTLLLGFYCQVCGETTICVDHEELSSASWLKRDDPIDITDDASLTSEMIQNFRKGLI